MNIEEIKKLIDIELKKYKKDRLNDFYHEFIDISIYLCSGGTNSYLLSTLFENKILDIISILSCNILTILIIYNNHDKYTIDKNIKRKICLLKKIKKELEKDINKFEDIEKDIFEKEYIKKI